MKSLFFKVLLATLATFVVALGALLAVSRTLPRRGPNPGDLLFRMISLIEDQACDAFEEGGAAQLRVQLRRIDDHLPGEHLLTDAQGRDLASGADRSDLLRDASWPGTPLRLVAGRHILVGTPRSGRYRFFSIIPPWPEPPGIWPDFAAIVLVITLFGAGFAVHLVAPLLRLRRVVDAFGQGDLQARVGSNRRDEIGALGRAFDKMAGRIETLLAAERRLLQDVSHEFRSPLARLGFAIELARTSDDQAAALDRIQKDVGRLNLLVNELLQLTRVEGDPTILGAEEIALDDLLRAVANDSELEASPKHCRLTLLTTPTPIRGDRELLRRALENVLRNAIRHAPPATVIETELHQQPTPPTAIITIRDHGPGVPDAVLSEIFQPFFRVEGDRSRISGGVGLGLSIASRAIHLHQGQITAQNTHPGLQVTIHLPNPEPILPPRVQFPPA